MSDNVEETELGRRVIESFWRDAQQNVLRIATYQPDLVIGLAHGGILPTKATSVAWEVMMASPFPPLLYTNIGREKLRRYDLWRRERRMGYYYATQGSLHDIVHFLTWLEDQHDWLNDFHSQIEQLLGRAPQSVVVLDEQMAEGNTYILALGMLEILYPHAVSYFIDGIPFSWRQHLADYWLLLHHPVLYRHFKENEQVRDYEHYNCLYSVVSGTEDFHPDKLNFRAITPDNPNIRYLSRYLPFEEWKEMSAWIEHQVLEDVKKKAREAAFNMPGRSPHTLDYRYTNDLVPYVLLKHIHRWGQITIGEAVQLAGLPEPDVRELLESMIRSLNFEAGEYKMDLVERMKTSAGVTYGYIEKPPVPEPPIRQSERHQALKRQLVRQRNARLRTVRRHRGK